MVSVNCIDDILRVIGDVDEELNCHVLVPGEVLLTPVECVPTSAIPNLDRGDL